VRKGSTQVEAFADGVRLDRFLAQRFSYRSRTQWGELIREGRITVNGTRVRPARILHSGDLVGYVPLPRPEPPIDPEVQTLYVDEHLIGVAKTGNLPIHPSGRYFHHTLLHLLGARRPEWGDLRVIHRLDRETSGVVIFGRTRATTEAVARQFRGRRVRKEYLALVSGTPPVDRFVIDRPLGKAPESLIRKAVGVREDGAPARTEIEVLHSGEDWSWVAAYPLTGRLHQIRAHLKSVGHPIVGDKVYGHDERFFLKFVSDEPFTPEEQALLALPRQALHAYRLTINHPATDEPLVLTAPLPPDLAAALAERGLDPSPWQTPQSPD
jgi:RluA family pseudouridine synthase